MLSGLALGQSVQQGGAYVSGHVPIYSTPTFGSAIVTDGGGAAGGGPGVGLSELNITARGTGTAPYAGQGTGPLGTIGCLQDAMTTNPTGYHYLCMSANAQGGGLIAYGAAGGASALPLNFNLNGTVYQFPFVLPGTGVIGPVTSIVNDIACWNNTSGTLLKDCGGRAGVTPTAYGASLASSDNTAALKAAFESGNEIYLDGMYQAIGPVTVSGCPSIRGGNPATTGIKFTGTGGGLAITCSQTANTPATGHVFLRNFGVITTSSAGGGTAVSINYSAYPPATVPVFNLDMENLIVSGDVYTTHYWTNGVVINNGSTVNVYRNLIVGHANAYADTASGITISNSAGASAMVVNILGNSVFQVDKAINMVTAGGIEGVVIRDNLLVTVGNAIYLDASASASFPPSFLISGNQTAAVTSIFANKVAQLYITSNTLYTSTQTGFCIDIVNSLTVMIDGTNACVNISGVAGTSAAMRVRSGGPGVIGGGYVNNFANAVELQASSTDWQVYPFSHGTGTTTTISNAGANNYIQRNDGATQSFSGVIAPNSIVNTGGYRQICNSPASPASAATGFFSCSNFSGGSGEVNFFNLQNNGPGFDWYQKTGAATQTKLATLAFQNGAGNLTVRNFQFSAAVLVGALPACNAGNTGLMYLVSDANGPVYATNIAGGGAVYAIALCNGANWQSH